VDDDAEPLLLLFSEKSPRARQLHQAFDRGLKTIIENGRYLAVVQQYLGAGGLPAGTIDRLKRLNPGWK
jgi:ABC-type amino acid transport substrate-binding protein